MWVKALRPGSFTDLFGKTITFTKDDLQAIADDYKPTALKSPVTKGHNFSVGAPAEGWIQAAKMLGDALLLDVDELVPAFAEQVKQGAYKYVSICLDKTRRKIKHLAFLGAENPAVDNLGELQAAFSSAKDEGLVPVAFSDWRMQSTGSLFQRIRDFFIEKNGLEAADSVLPQWEIDSLKREPQAETAYSTPIKEKIMVPETQVNASEFARILAENATLRQTQAATDKKVEAMAFAQQRKEDDAVLVALGSRIPQANRGVFLEVVSALRGIAEPIAFSEGVKKPAAEALLESLKALPEAVALSAEIATSDKAQPDSAAAKLDLIVQAKMKAEPKLECGVAFAAAQRENVALAQAYALEVVATRA